LAHSIACLRCQASPLALSANGDLARFAGFHLATLPDSGGIPDGPLAGVLTGLRWAQQNTTAQWLVTAPVDTPFLPLSFVARLRAGIGGPDQIAVARSRQQLHPVAALWPVRIADGLADWLSRQGNRAVREWIEAQSSTVVDFEDENGFDPFFNINTPADLDKARHHAGMHPGLHKGWC
jgi:molybdopterin-guanine dinucleotide biosynthesis protein A